MKKFSRAGLILVLMVLAGQCFAGRLDDFEVGLDQPTSVEDKSSESSSSSHSHKKKPEPEPEPATVSDVFAESIFNFFGVILQIGAQTSYELQQNYKAGEGLLPLMRMEMQLQYLGDGLYAVDLSSQLGYGPFLITAQVSDYREIDPLDTLTLFRWGLGGRFTLSEMFQFNLIGGVMQFAGNSTATRLVLSTPVVLIVEPYVFEYLPTFANNITEHDFAVRYQRRYWSAAVGYRALVNPSSTLKGPYVGASIFW